MIRVKLFLLFYIIQSYSSYLEFRNVPNLDNTNFRDYSTLHFDVTSLLVCAQFCLQHDRCRSFSFRKDQSHCVTHDTKFTSTSSGTDEQGWKYYSSRYSLLCMDNWCTGHSLQGIVSSDRYSTSFIQNWAKEKYRRMFQIQKSGDKTSSGEIGLDTGTHASPKVGQD